jgi:hypothetical protein
MEFGKSILTAEELMKVMNGEDPFSAKSEWFFIKFYL